jgi:hypothetical protein
MKLPTHYERQLMQQLRGRGWVRANALPPVIRTIENLLRKGWIESGGVGRDFSYRLTEQGMAAKTAPIPLYGKAKVGRGH